MADIDDRFRLDEPFPVISFQTPTERSLPLHVREVTLAADNDEIVKCCLVVVASFDSYQLIDIEELFNLNPAVRHETGAKFNPEQAIEIDIRLDEAVLAYLTELTESFEVVQFLLELSKNELGHPLLFTENWYGLYVKQQVPISPDLATDAAALAAGYSTAWADMEPDGDEFEAWPETDLDVGVQDSLWETVKDFFEESSVWSSCTQLPEQTVLRLKVQTEDTLLTCYAQVVEYQDLCSFYSLCPIEIPEAQRLSVMEYITRVNYDLPIGNFELNLDVGEVRFKTSIDVEGDRLSEALLQALTRANLEIMIDYLPGIYAIVKDGISAQKALEID